MCNSNWGSQTPSGFCPHKYSYSTLHPTYLSLVSSKSKAFDLQLDIIYWMWYPKKKTDIDQDNIQSWGVKFHLLRNTLWIPDFQPSQFKSLEWRGSGAICGTQTDVDGCIMGVTGAQVVRWHAG
ncbi:hypothetical protein C8J57DRAFT_1256364 [Mycena rebaudengoi]|nr:hypothetical protein C8J57DRAFT_1256364 [Mycena rebaudengoi]